MIKNKTIKTFAVLFLIGSLFNFSYAEQKDISVKTSADAAKYYNKGDESEKKAAFQFFLENAARDIKSLYYLGVITYNGEFTIPKDKELGMRMIIQASDSKLTEAKIFIAKSYIEGDVEADKTKGIEILVSRDFERTPDVLFYLGNLYDEGKYVPQSKYYAERYYLEAARFGNLEAAYRIGKIYINDPEPSKKDKGWELMKRSANNGNGGACNIMADKYREDVITKNYKIAEYISFLKCSADDNNPEAAKEYANYLLIGKYVKNDSVNAYKYFKIYLDNNKEPITPETYFQIGILSVQTGNKATAEETLRKASASGIENASYYIARLAETGFWTGLEDPKTAKDYYELAGKQGRKNIEIDLQRVSEKINLSKEQK